MNASRRSATVGLALIVHNEEHNLPRLLDSIAGTFDHVALVDSDSTDATLDLFRQWCARTNQPHTIDNFPWIDDFAAKRNHAQALLDTNWICWADADDTIDNAHQLRKLANVSHPGLAAWLADYDYLHDETGECTVSFTRERLVKHGHGTWTGRTHDMQLIDGPAIHTTTVRWTHHRHDFAESTERDRRIIETWHRDEPDNPHVTAALTAYHERPAAFDHHVRLALEADWQRTTRQHTTPT